MSIFLKVLLSKHSREVTINKGLKQSTAMRVILKNLCYRYLLLQDSNKKILKLFFFFFFFCLILTNFHQIIGHEETQNNDHNLL